MTDLVVVYQTSGGHTGWLAEAIVGGARRVEGVSAELSLISGEKVRQGRFEDPAMMQRLD